MCCPINYGVKKFTPTTNITTGVVVIKTLINNLTKVFHCIRIINPPDKPYQFIIHITINIQQNKKPHLEMGFNKLGPNKPIFQEGPFLKLVI
jgi:hypothetical protein